VPALEAEVALLVRSDPLASVDIPDALNFLVGDKLDPTVRCDLKVRYLSLLQDFLAHVRLLHLLLWFLVSPNTAISFFEHRYRNDMFILQYAHRVLEQHPVCLTLFFVPQVVQALRYDDLGAFEMLLPPFSFLSMVSPPQAMSLISFSRPPRYRSCFATRQFGT